MKSESKKKAVEKYVINFENGRKDVMERMSDMVDGAEKAGLELSEPVPIVDISTLSTEDWKKYRTRGFGGSDAGTVLGMNHFNDLQNLYRSKRGEMVEETIDYATQARFDAGHQMEPVIAKIFSAVTGFKVVEDTVMYHHSAYPFMIADVDDFCYDLDGVKCGVEFKYINLDDLKMKWRSGVNGKNAKIGNLSYLVQSQHYMSVLNLDRWYLAVWAGNVADDIVIIRIDRDYEAEKYMIDTEAKAWEDIQNGNEPTLEEKSSYAFAKMMPTYDDIVADETNGVLLDSESEESEMLRDYNEKCLEINKEISEKSSDIKQLEAQKNALYPAILDLMKSETDKNGVPVNQIVLPADEGHSYVMNYSSFRTSTSFNRKGLSAADPETYEYLEKNGFITSKKSAPSMKICLKDNRYIDGYDTLLKDKAEA